MVPEHREEAGRWSAVRTRTDASFARLRAFGMLVLRRFREDRCNQVAEALSYTTLLSLVPLTTVAFALVSAFPVSRNWMTSIQGFIYTHFVPAAGAEVQKYLQQFSQKSAQLTAAGLGLLVLTSLMLMAMIEDSFNAIWRVPKQRETVYRFLVYWAILTLGPLLAGVSVSVTYYVTSLSVFSYTPGVRWVRVGLGDVLPFILSTLIFLLLYTIVPNAQVRWKHALQGSVFAAFLFAGAKYGFALFVMHYSSYQFIYGALAALPVFLMWIYLSWMVILLGAVLVSLLPEWELMQRAARQASAAPASADPDI